MYTCNVFLSGPRHVTSVWLGILVLNRLDRSPPGSHPNGSGPAPWTGATRSCSAGQVSDGWPPAAGPVGAPWAGATFET